VLPLVAEEEVRAVAPQGAAEGEADLRARQRVFAAERGVEEVARVQRRVGEDSVELTVEGVAPIGRDGVDLPAEVATQLGVPQERGDREVLDRLQRLRHERDEALTAHAHVRVVVVRAVHGEVVRAGAHPVDGELPGRADAVADAGAARSGRVGRRRDTRREQRELVEAAHLRRPADGHRVEEAAAEVADARHVHRPDERGRALARVRLRGRLRARLPRARGVEHFEEL
jgi:hypothetical protein